LLSDCHSFFTEYLAQFPKIESVLFGASSKEHIQETKALIEQTLSQKKEKLQLV